MTKPLICIPVIDTSLEKMISSIHELQKHADVIEIRADFIPDLQKRDIEELFKASTKQTIFTLRHKMEGGKWQGSEEDRQQLLQHAINLGFTYVDVELDTIKEHAFPKTSKTKLIISFHDFKETPDYWDLTKIVDEMSSFSPDVYKIATMVNKDRDVQALFRLLANKQGKQMIVAGMGKEGAIVRALSPYMGSLVTFASSEKGVSAPGQINYKELRKLYQLLEEII